MRHFVPEQVRYNLLIDESVNIIYIIFIMTKKQKPDDRKYQILTAALAVAERPGGFSKLTREAVAKEVGCAESLISRYFGTIPSFKRTIIRSAILTENLAIIAQGLAIGDPHAQKADESLKRKALDTLAG
jgi:AcrR family transcriptional regulator